MNTTKNTKITLLVLLGLCFLVYLPSLKYDFVSLDDDELIIENPLLTEFNLSTLKSIVSDHQMGHYLPLTTATYFVQYQLHGPNPMFFRLFNILLHLINVYLVFQVLIRLEFNHNVVLFSTALFALHPMNVESVGWISARSNLLFSCFYLLGIISYLRANRVDILTGIIFVAALLSKSHAVTFPITLILIDWYLKPNFNLFKAVTAKITLFIGAVFFGILAIYFAGQFGTLETSKLSSSIIEKPLILSYSMAFYLLKYIAPLKLCALHFNPIRVNDSLPIIYFLALLFMGGLSLFLYLKLKSKAVKFGLFLFLAQIILVSGIFSIGNVVVAERYTYLAYVGLSVAVGNLFVRMNHFKWILIGLPILFSWITSDRLTVWQSSLKLYEDVILKYPEHGYGYYGKASALIEQNALDSAIYFYGLALKNTEYFPNAYLNRASCYSKKGDYQLAILDLDSAIIQKTNYHEAYFNKGMIMYKLGNLYEAEIQIKKSIEMGNATAIAYYQLGSVYFDSRQYLKSVEANTKAIAANASFSSAYLNRGNAYFALNNLAQAQTDYLNAIRTNSKELMAYYNLGNVYYLQQKKEEACQAWRQAIILGYEPAKNQYADFCLQYQQ